MAKKPTYEELEQRVKELEQDVREFKRTEGNLRETHDYLENLFNYANAPIIVWNPESRIVRFNHAFEHLTGYKDEEVIGKKLNMLFPKANRDETLNKISRTLSGEYWESVEIAILCKDGDTKIALWNSANIYAEDGKTLLTTIAQGQDITKRKRAEEALLNQKYFLQKAQELGHIGTWELDIKKNELLWTDENYRIFGLPIGTKLTYEIFMDRVHPDDREYVDKEWKAAFDKQPYDIEHRLLVDGKVKWVREKAKLQFNEKDECIRGTGVTQDITVRKHLEEQVKQKLIALTQPEVDVGGLSLHDILGVDILQRLQDAFAEAFNMPSIIYGPDGKPFTTPSCFTSFCKLVRNTEKGATNCEAFDGELMQVLRKNQTPHIRHGCVLKNIVTGTVPIVIQGQHLANWGFGQRVNRNLDLDEVRRYALTIGVDEKALIEAAGDLKLVDDAAFERIVNFAKTLSDQIGLLALQNLQQGRAISEQMRVEKSLYEAKLFLDNISDLAYIADKEGNVIYANRAAEKLTGLALSEIIDQPFLPLFVEKDHDSLIDAYNKTLAGESLENILTFNTEITCDFTSLPFKDNHGNIIGTFGIARDISDRLRTEKALSKSDARLKKAQSVANLGNWEYDIPTGKVWGSEQSFRIYDIERTSPYLPLDRVEACISDASKVQQALADLIQENKPYDIEFWIQQEASGQTVVIHSIAELVYENGMPVKVVGVIQDVTEQKREEKARKDLEAQLQQAQKMEAIGTLAGGIAHDFNNILGGIIGYAELAKMKAPEGSNVIAYLDKMIKSSDRAADLIKQILTLSRQHKQKQRPVQVRHIVKEALDLLRATLPTTIEIRRNLAKDAGVVNADPTQMHQVIMNLTTNAGHAMQENGGVLEVTLANVELDDLSASKHLDLTAGFFLRLTVSDTGHGMTPETMERIFDPYFTTKDTGEGTGLGLSVAHGIVKAHGGAITVYSELGKGTTFHVYLPVIHEAEKAEKDEPKEALPTGSERILFIDDEEVLLEIGGQMLELLGYEVVTKISSEQALEMFRKQPDQFDLVITDMTMPHLTGDKLAQELMTIRPNIPVILCTGHSRLVSEEKAEEIGIKAFVIKPLVMRNLAETVRKVLDEK